MKPLTRRAYWQLTASLLTAHFAGWAAGMDSVIALTVLHALHCTARSRSDRRLDVQVRWFYLLLLVLGLAPGLGWIHLVQWAGVSALLVADYCAAARLLVLMPWNRSVPLTGALVRWALLSPPSPESIIDRLPQEP